MPQDLFAALLLLVWLVSELLGYFGAFLIGYSIVATFAKPWPVIEAVAPLASALLTLIGTFLTAASIYLPTDQVRLPWRSSRVLVGPLILLTTVTAIVCLVWRGQISPVLVSGFGLLAISGGLKRTLPKQVEKLIAN